MNCVSTTYAVFRNLASDSGPSNSAGRQARMTVSLDLRKSYREGILGIGEYLKDHEKRIRKLESLNSP